MSVIFSRHYDIGLLGLERLHPFDARKYGRAFKTLKRRFGRDLGGWLTPTDRQASAAELSLVHPAAHLAGLRSPATLAGALELPLVARLPAWLSDRAVLRPMRWATRGTILAAEAALDHGWAVNLAGGYHHASATSAEGFCVYADVPIAVAAMRNAGALAPDDRVLYIDTDAHQGNGVARAFLDDPRARLYDLYNGDLYPNDREAIARLDADHPLPSGTADDAYLALLERTLPAFLDAHAAGARLAIYNAGTDVFAGDTLGALALSADAVLARERLVLTTLSARGLPWLMVPSGGYSRTSHSLLSGAVAAHLERL